MMRRSCSLLRATYIVDALRTGIARGKPDGILSTNYHPVDLYSAVLKGISERNNNCGNRIEDVVTGVVTPVQKQGANVGRLAALKAGFPVTTPGVQLNRMCGSGQQAVHFASQAIAAEDIELAIGGGVEMMGTVEMGSDTDLFNPEPTEFKKNFPYKLVHQGVSAEMLSAKYGITREECDDFAVRSHTLAHAAQEKGMWDDCILPLPVTTMEGAKLHFNIDEGVRYPVNQEKLRSLKTVFKQEGGVVTAGNASQISDGAAAVLVASDKACVEYSLNKKARIITRVSLGSDPVIMLDGVIAATQLALQKANMNIDEIDVFEVNEAFACVVLAWQKTLNVNPHKVNPCGGAVAHGHPLGASGAVLMAKLVNQLVKGNKRFGLQTMCIGHGMATATIIENISS